MKKINITITGALGRMGKILIKRISKNKNLKLFSLTDIKSGKKLNGIKIQKNNLEAFKKTDVIIDFSRPKASLEILNYAKKFKSLEDLNNNSEVKNFINKAKKFWSGN